MFKEAGFEILSEENEPSDPKNLGKIRLASEFQKYSKDDLLVLRSWMVTKPIHTESVPIPNRPNVI
jgi:hypothetical protein